MTACLFNWPTAVVFCTALVCMTALLLALTLTGAKR